MHIINNCIERVFFTLKHFHTHWLTERRKCAVNLPVGKADTQPNDSPMSGDERNAKPGLRSRSEIFLAHQRHDSETIHPGQEESISWTESL